MSLLSELEARGVTAEDLEKAASVRHFEKAAAAEGVNLDELGEDQVEELYASYIHNHTSSAQGDLSKEATAMNDEIVDLFEKTAAAEGIDLDVMDDNELVELYNHYVENVLPEQLAEYDDDDEYDKEASFDEYDDEYDDGEYLEEEAYEKLAEAEILGRHMARAYMDEMDKEATSRRTKQLRRELGLEQGPVGGYGKPTGKGGKPSKKQREAAREVGRRRRGADGVRRVGKGSKSKLIEPHKREFRGSNVNLATTKAKMNAVKRFAMKHKVPLAAGGALAAGAGAGYLAGREKAASALIEELAEEMAIGMLIDAGYEFE